MVRATAVGSYEMSKAEAGSERPSSQGARLAHQRASGKRWVRAVLRAVGTRRQAAPVACVGAQSAPRSAAMHGVRRVSAQEAALPGGAGAIGGSAACTLRRERASGAQLWGRGLFCGRFGGPERWAGIGVTELGVGRTSVLPATGTCEREQSCATLPGMSAMLPEHNDGMGSLHGQTGL